MEAIPKRPFFFVRHIALPQDHGSWVFLFSPLLIGLFAAQSFTIASLILVIAALAAFLLRQPASIMVKAYSGRRSSRDLPIARFWIVVYSLIGLAAFSLLTTVSAESERPRLAVLTDIGGDPDDQQSLVRLISA